MLYELMSPFTTSAQHLSVAPHLVELRHFRVGLLSEISSDLIDANSEDTEHDGPLQLLYTRIIAG
jgi:hypothetical protein